MKHPSALPATFALRYAQLARSVGLDPEGSVLVALSGGADSVLLLHLVAAAAPRPPAVAVHVDHGLRGAESEADVVFCERLCARLRIPFVVRRLHLDPEGPSLEARAREARYRVLCEEAERRGASAVLTGHHADDALETLLMRWSRGTALGGLAGLRARALLAQPSGRAPIAVVRPLIHLRREEVRCLLRGADIEWREDSSNQDPRFTRNRVRGTLLPRIADACGEAGVEHLHAFGRAVEGLELELAGATAHLAWQPLASAAATRGLADAHLGGSLPRSALMHLPRALRRRAVWRLLREGTGTAPRRALLERVLAHLETGRAARHALALGWSLKLGAERLVLSPPPDLLARTAPPRDPAGAFCQRSLPFPPPDDRARAPFAAALPVAGLVDLPGGRRLGAELVERPFGARPPRSAVEVELDALALRGPLEVRFPRAGDRFHPLGAPGSRPLARFLADAGVPRGERPLVPLVVCAERILWVAGLRPAESARVRDDSRRRLRLRLYGVPEPRSGATPPPAPLLVEHQLFEAAR